MDRSAGPGLSAHDVARALRQRLPGLGKTKLHKLLYYCQGHHLAVTGQRLFRERVSAWDLGPVVGELWHIEDAESAEETPGRAATEAELNTVGYVVSRYGSLSTRDLVNLTHAETPWRRADAGRAPGDTVEIPAEWLAEFFSAEADADLEEGAAVVDRDLLEGLLAGVEERRYAPPIEDSIPRLRQRLADAS